MADPQDPLTALLTSAPIGESVRADAWDAFRGSANEKELAAKLQKLPMPQETKAQLWDLKHQGAGESPAMNFAKVNGQDVPVDDDTGVGALVSHAASQMNPLPGINTLAQALPLPKAMGGGGVPIPQALGGSGMDAASVKTIQQIGAAHGATYDKARASYAKGEYGTAARHFVDYLIPIIGPAMDKSADEMQAGKYAAGMGDALGIGLSLFGPQKLGELGVKLKGLPANVNPAEAEAVQFGEARGVPIDAATRSGNAFVRGAQRLSDHTIGGSIIARRARQAQAGALDRVGGELAETANAAPVTAEQAGAGVASDLTKYVSDQNTAATAAYDRLREIEANPKFARTVVTKLEDVPTGVLDAQGKPILRQQQTTQTIPLPVYLKGPKAMLQPIYDRLRREAQLVPLQGDKARALTALDRLMNGPDVAPASVVDGALGDLKAMARSDIPELRTQGQGLAAQAVMRLDQAVKTAVQRAGPEAIQALNDGRQATIAKYRAGDVLKELSEEPVKAYRQAVAPKDSGIEFLRSVQEFAPQQMGRIGRAYLEDVLGTATAEGGFDRAARLQAEWQKLGPQTKQQLFGAELTPQLDKFFLLAKKIGENPNPSGTAYQSAITAQMVGAVFSLPNTIMAEVGAAGLAKLLYSPTFTGALTKGMQLQVSGATMNATAKAAAIANIIRAATEAGVSLPESALNPAVQRSNPK